MLWTIIGLLVILWVLGLVTKVGGALIHILLVLAVIVFVINLFRGRASQLHCLVKESSNRELGLSFFVERCEATLKDLDFYSLLRSNQMGSPLYHDIEGGPPMYKRTYLIFSMLRLWNSLMLIFYIYKMIFLLFF